MYPQNRFRWFREDLCNRCGECFKQCPVLSLPEDRAKKEIGALIAGNLEDSLAFHYCTTCNVCDSVCPKSADPYELILESYDDYAKKHGLPFLAKLILPNERENIWSSLRLLMDQEELSSLSRWENNLRIPKKEILLTGFYTNIVPYLVKGSILDELQPVIAGSEGSWGCGGDSNKLGSINMTEQVVELVQRQFVQMGVEKVYCFMEAEAAMLAEVLPRRYSARFDFQILPFEYWLLEKINSGAMRFDQKLNLKATIHDNCMSRYFGGKPQEVVREIVSATGCEIVEMEHNRFRGLCCGWAATIPRLYGEHSGNPVQTMMYLLHSLYRRLQEAKATEADVMVTACPACYIFLSLIKELTNDKIEVLHPLQLVNMAAGERYPYKTRQRCWEILAVATNLVLKWGLSSNNRKRFLPQPINMSSIQTLAKPMESDARRIKCIASLYRSPAVQNPLSRAFMGGLTKASIATYRVQLARKLRTQAGYS
jgi:Fe-S oxidoreductase